MKVLGPSGADIWSNVPVGTIELERFDGFGAVYRKQSWAGEGRWLQQDRDERFVNGRRVVSYTRPQLFELNGVPTPGETAETIEVRYDETDRPQTVWRLRGTQQIRLESDAYAPRETTVTDANNHQATFRSDERGLLGARKTAVGDWLYERDALGRLTRLIMPTGETVEIGYDSWGRRRALRDPFAGDNRYTYDDVGNMLTDTDGRGVTMTYAYDEANRKLTKSGPTSGMVRFYYDRSAASRTMGRLAAVEEPAGSTVLEYDASGNLALKRVRITGSPAALESSYRYDAMNRLSEKQFPDNSTVRYGYHDGAHLREVQLDGVPIARFSNYGAGGAPRTKWTPAGTTTAQFDASGWLTELRTQSARNVTVQDYHIERDLLGQVTRVDDLRAQTLVGGVESSESQSFTYDPLGRLKSAQGASYGQATYGYDATGRMLKKGAVSFAHGSLDITATRGAEFVASQRYDLAGDLIARSDASGELKLEYDDDRRPVVFRKGGEVILEARYNYFGERVEKVYTDPSGQRITTRYVDGFEERQSAAQPGTHAWTKQVIAPGIGLIASKTMGQIAGQAVLAPPPDVLGAFSGNVLDGPAVGTVYHLNNHSGSVAGALDESGALVSRLVYEPFGEQQRQASLGTDVSSLKFDGKERDDETGLSYYGARYYDPTFGRFTTADTQVPDGARNPQALNRHAYVFNNPLSYTDPNGHFPWLAVGVGIAIYGAWEAGRQIASSEPVSGSRLMGAFLNGAVTGGLVGMTAGLSELPALADLAWTAYATTAGGMARRAVTGDPQTLGAVSTDAVSGLFGGLLGRGLNYVASTISPVPPAILRGNDYSPTATRLDAAGGATRITSGSQVTEQVIRDAMRGAPLRSQQAGGVSSRRGVIWAWRRRRRGPCGWARWAVRRGRSWAVRRAPR
jgi:RHS repeat-associated protein